MCGAGRFPALRVGADGERRRTAFHGPSSVLPPGKRPGKPVAGAHGESAIPALDQPDLASPTTGWPRPHHDEAGGARPHHGNGRLTLPIDRTAYVSAGIQVCSCREHLAREAVDQLRAVSSRVQGSQCDGSTVERLHFLPWSRASEDPAARRSHPAGGPPGLRLAVHGRHTRAHRFRQPSDKHPADAGMAQRCVPISKSTGTLQKRTEPQAYLGMCWWSLRDSNSQPPACKAGALPIAPRPPGW